MSYDDINFGDIAAILFLPLMAFSIVTYWIAKLSPAKTAANIFCGILVCAYFFLWQWYGTYSLIVLYDYYIGMMVVGVGLIGGAIFYWYKNRNASDDKRDWGVVYLLYAPILGLPLAVGSGWVLADEILKPRAIVEGFVQNLFSRKTSRGPRYYFMSLNGREFSVTTRQFSMFKVGDPIRAEVGGGSGYFLAVERLPASSTSQMPFWPPVVLQPLPNNSSQR